MSNNLCQIGKTIKPFGIKGEILAKFYKDPRLNEYINQIRKVYLIKHDNIIEFKVRYIKKHNINYIINLYEVTSRNQSESLVDFDVCIDKTQIRISEDNSYYWFEILGANALDIHNKYIGKIISIYNNGVYDVFVIQKDDSNIEYYIPALPQFLKKFDKPNHNVYFELIEGLLSINHAV